MIKHPELKRNIPETTKHRIFRIFHKIITIYSIPSKFYIFLLILEFIQMLFYVIHPSYEGIWSLTFLPSLQFIFGFIATPNIWKLIGSIGLMCVSSICTLELNIVIVLFAILIAIVCYEVFSDECKGNEQNMVVSKFIGYMCLLIKTILTIPIISLATTFIGGS